MNTVILKFPSCLLQARVVLLWVLKNELTLLIVYFLFNSYQHCWVLSVKCCEEPDRSQDKMTGNTFAIEVIIPRLKGNSADLIPSVRGLGTPCLIQENVCDVLIIGMSFKHCRCSVSKTYKQQEKARVHVLDFFPLLYSCRNLYFPRQHESAFSPWKKGEHNCSRLPRKREDKILNWLIMKVSHYPWCHSPLEKHRWDQASSRLPAASSLKGDSSESFSQCWCSQPPFCSPCTTQFEISHHRVWRAACKTRF